MAGAACAVLTLVACVGVTVKSPPDLSGEWTFTTDRDFRGNPTTLDGAIKQNHTELSVRFRDGVEMLGTVTDRAVTWEIPIPAGVNSPAFKVTYTGTVAPSGDAIEGTWHLIGLAGGDSDGKFKATRKSN